MPIKDGPVGDAAGPGTPAVGGEGRELLQADPTVGGGRITRWLAVVSLLAAVSAAAVAVAGGAYLYRQLLALGEQATSQARHMETLFTRVDDQLEDVSSKSHSGDNLLASHMEHLQGAVQRLQENSARADRDWVLAETRSLLVLAQQRLLLLGDIDTSIAALRAADGQLHRLADIRLLPVRKELAREIGLLRNVPRPDIASHLLTLLQLLRHSDSLPLVPTATAGANAATHEDAGVLAATPPAESLRDRLIRHLGRLFTVTRPGPDTPMPDTDATVATVEQHAALQATLQAAQAALLRNDTVAYYRALQAAEQHVQDDFDPGSDQVARFLEDLARLQSSPVQPDLHDIGKALELLNTIVASGKAAP